MSDHSGHRTCPQSSINPLLSAGGAGCEPSLGAVWLILPGAGTPREAEPQRFRCWSRWGSLSAWELLLLCYRHSCRVPSAPVPCSSTWSSWAGQGAALGRGSQCHQCPLKSSVCFTSISSAVPPSVPGHRAVGRLHPICTKGCQRFQQHCWGIQGCLGSLGFTEGYTLCPSASSWILQLDSSAGRDWSQLWGPNQGLSHRERLSFLR